MQKRADKNKYNFEPGNSTAIKLHWQSLSRFFRGTLLTFISLFSIFFSYAQFPVHITPQLISPYTLQLNDYYNGSNPKLIVTLINKDLLKPTITVRLRMDIQGQSAKLTSKDYVYYPPITLDAGIPQQLSLSDLAPYFNPDNLNFEGITRAQYQQQGKIPEGYYQFCFEAIEVSTNEIASLKKCASAWISLSDPPLLNLPKKTESIAFREPTNIIFNWTPRHLNSPNSAFNTEYEFQLVELWDNGIDPVAAFQTAQPLYQTTVKATTLLYGPAEPILIPGKKYGWRVRAKAKSGIDDADVFRNNGYSEVFWFTCQDNCQPPANVTATVQNGRVTLTWLPQPQMYEYNIEYREASPFGGGLEGAGAQWFSQKTTATQATIYDVQPGKTYQYRIGGSCSIGGGIVFGELKAFTIPARNITRDSACGILPNINIANQTAIQSLTSGDVILAGDFPVKLLQVTGQTSFTGNGYVTVPFLGEARVKVKFNNIGVNTDKQLISGVIETTFDSTMKGIYDLDDIFEGGSDVGFVKTGTDTVNYNVDFVIGLPQDTVAIIPAVDGKGGYVIIIKDNNGKDYQLPVASLPATIKDKDGNIYQVDKDGNLIPIGKTVDFSGMTKAQLNTLASDKAVVKFVANPKQQYAFDEWKKIYGGSNLWSAKYEKLLSSSGEDYRVNAKAIVPGKTDVVTAHITITDNRIKPDSIKFITGTGTQLTYKRNNNEYEINIIGGPAGDAQELYALYPSALLSSPVGGGQEGAYISLGKLLIASYQPQKRKLVLVPVNGAAISSGQEKVANKLNAIYNKVGVEWEVTQDNNFSDDSWDTDNDGLDIDGSGLFSTLTPEMKALNKTYKNSGRAIDDKTIYLFVLNKAAGQTNIIGDMPRGKQFGYLFTGSSSFGGGWEEVALTAAHEVGHGVFRLKHTFDGYGFSKNELPENVMDYSGGETFSKLQWDALHDPALVVGLFEKDEDGASVDISNLFALNGEDEILDIKSPVSSEPGLGISPDGRIVINAFWKNKDQYIIHVISKSNPYVIVGFNIYEIKKDKDDKEIVSDQLIKTYGWSKNGYYNGIDLLPVTYSSENSAQPVRIYQNPNGCTYEKQVIQWVSSIVKNEEELIANIKNSIKGNWEPGVLYKPNDGCFGSAKLQKIYKDEIEKIKKFLTVNNPFTGRQLTIGYKLFVSYKKDVTKPEEIRNFNEFVSNNKSSIVLWLAYDEEKQSNSLHEIQYPEKVIQELDKIKFQKKFLDNIQLNLESIVGKEVIDDIKKNPYLTSFIIQYYVSDFLSQIFKSDFVSQTFEYIKISPKVYDVCNNQTSELLAELLSNRNPIIKNIRELIEYEEIRSLHPLFENLSEKDIRNIYFAFVCGLYNGSITLIQSAPNIVKDITAFFVPSQKENIQSRAKAFYDLQIVDANDNSKPLCIREEYICKLKYLVKETIKDSFDKDLCNGAHEVGSLVATTIVSCLNDAPAFETALAGKQIQPILKFLKWYGKLKDIDTYLDKFGKVGIKLVKNKEGKLRINLSVGEKVLVEQTGENLFSVKQLVGGVIKEVVVGVDDLKNISADNLKDILISESSGDVLFEILKEKLSQPFKNYNTNTQANEKSIRNICYNLKFFEKEIGNALAKKLISGNLDAIKGYIDLIKKCEIANSLINYRSVDQAIDLAQNLINSAIKTNQLVFEHKYNDLDIDLIVCGYPNYNNLITAYEVKTCETISSAVKAFKKAKGQLSTVIAQQKIVELKILNGEEYDFNNNSELLQSINAFLISSTNGIFEVHIIFPNGKKQIKNRQSSLGKPSSISVIRQIITKPSYKPLRTIFSKANKTTTFIGKWDEEIDKKQNGLKEVKKNLSESDLNIYMQSGKFDHPGGFNMLSVDDWDTKVVPEAIKKGIDIKTKAFDDFIWDNYNQPWLESALQRGDDIVIWSDPFSQSNIQKYFQKENFFGKSFYGRELEFIQKNASKYGYNYNNGISSGTFIKQ
jgi:hypothetical protein